MIDTHAHIDAEAFNDDRDAVIKRAFDSGLDAIIIPGIEPKNFQSVLDLCHSYDNIFCGLGVHPHDAEKYDKTTESFIRSAADDSKVKAIGEIGLDYYYDFNPRDKQIEVFQKQLALAKELDLPVIVHNRESDEDLIENIKNMQDGSLRGVLHCFSSDVEVLKRALDLNFLVSFTGNITFKKSTLDEVVRMAPIDRIMIETDSPYMTPVPYRGKRNEPEKVRYVAEKIAEIKSISTEEVINMTTNNARKFFNLFVLALFFVFGSLSLYAQNEEDYDEENGEEVELQDGEYIDEETGEVMVNPFERFIGFGPVIGANTVVQSQAITNTEGEIINKSISYDGIVAYGGRVLWGVTDYLLLEGAYTYSKNTKIAEENVNIDPFTYTVYNLSSHWIPNPRNRINFFATAGLTYFSSNISVFDEVSGLRVPKTNNQMGMNFGLGLFVNFNMNDYGMLTLSAEWRVDFKLANEDMTVVEYDGSKEVPLKADVSEFFSIPRFGIIWYPPF